MHYKMLLLASGVVFVCGCSSSQKKPSAEVPVATSVALVKTEVPPKAEVSKDEMTCKRGDEKRLLEIESLQPKGCKLWYSRFETRSSVANSVFGKTYCELVREKIRVKLVEAGFECIPVRSGTTPSVSASPASATTIVDDQKKAEPAKK